MTRLLALSAATALLAAAVVATAQDADPAAAKIAFEDVTRKVLTPPELPQTLPQCWDVAFADVNADGKSDIVLGRGGPLPNSIWINKGDGTFSGPLTGLLDTGHTMYVTPCDRNLDGREDLILSNNDSFVFLNETVAGGEVKFASRVPWGPGGSANHYAAFGDLDGDGKPDYARCPTGTLILSDLAGGKEILQRYELTGGPILIADFENDDWPEVLVLGQPNHSHKQPDGTLAPEHEAFLLNRKGKLTDALMESGLGKTMALHGCGVAVDLNNDGLLDIVMAGMMSARNDPRRFNSLFRNNGDGTFTDVTADSGLNTVRLSARGWLENFSAGDFNNDGLVDFACSGVVYRNLGNFRFEKSLRLPLGPPPPYTFRHDAADYDGDGRLDLVLETSPTGLMVCHNVTTNANHWLKVRLKGPETNPEALLARVTLYEPGTQKIVGFQQVLKDASHASSRPHFGLGTLRTVDVKVHFQHGADHVFKNVTADREITVTSDGRMLN